MPTDKDLHQAFSDLSDHIDRTKYKTGTMGKVNSPGGNRIYDVDGRSGYSWVTLDNGTVVACINSGIGAMPRLKLPVLISNTPAGSKIWGMDHTKADNNLGPNMPEFGAGPHSHAFGSGLEYLVNALEYDPFLTYHRPQDASLTLYVAPLFYSNVGVDTYFPGGLLALGSISGMPTSGNWAWVRVGVDPSTNIPIGIAGTPQPLTTPLTPDQIPSISFPYLSSAAFKFRNGQTDFTNYETDFIDCRFWLDGSVGAGTSTITSVAFTPIPDFSVTGSPITTGSGTIVLSRKHPNISHYANQGNTGTSETDLYTDTLPANTLALDGDSLHIHRAGVLTGSATATREIKEYFGGTVIYDTGALSISLAENWDMDIWIVRDSSGSVRCTVDMSITNVALTNTPNYTAIGSLTFSGTLVSKVTGQSSGVGAATNDIVAKLSKTIWSASV